MTCVIIFKARQYNPYIIRDLCDCTDRLYRVSNICVLRSAEEKNHPSNSWNVSEFELRISQKLKVTVQRCPWCPITGNTYLFRCTVARSPAVCPNSPSVREPVTHSETFSWPPRPWRIELFRRLFSAVYSFQDHVSLVRTDPNSFSRGWATPWEVVREASEALRTV